MYNWLKSEPFLYFTLKNRVCYRYQTGKKSLLKAQALVNKSCRKSETKIHSNK